MAKPPCCEKPLSEEQVLRGIIGYLMRHGGEFASERIAAAERRLEILEKTQGGGVK